VTSIGGRTTAVTGGCMPHLLCVGPTPRISCKGRAALPSRTLSAASACSAVAAQVLSRLGDSKLATNQAGQAIPDFSMPRHRSALSVGRVLVDVVTRTMADEGATGPSEFTDELTSVQGA